MSQRRVSLFCDKAVDMGMIVVSFFFEYLPAGLLVVFALGSIFPSYVRELYPLNVPIIFLLLVLAYAGGIIASYLGEKMLTWQKNRIYLHALRDFASFTGDLVKRQLKMRNCTVSVDGIDEKENIQSAERIFNVMAYAIWEKGHWPAILTYYAFMQKVARSFILPLFLLAAALLYLDLQGNLGTHHMRHLIPVPFFLFSLLSWWAAISFIKRYGHMILYIFMGQEPVPRTPSQSPSRRRRPYHSRNSGTKTNH